MGDTRPILEFSRRMYDAVVADMGCAYGEWTLSAARISDEIFLTTTNELPSLQAAQRVMSYLENNGIAAQQIRLIVNRFNKDVGLSKEMIETAMQTEVYLLIPSGYEDAQQALLEGKPIAAASAVGKPIATLAARLAGKDSPDARKAEKAKSPGALSGLFGLFSRST
jgi:pilus assembly protein CpaE